MQTQYRGQERLLFLVFILFSRTKVRTPGIVSNYLTPSNPVLIKSESCTNQKPNLSGFLLLSKQECTNVGKSGVHHTCKLSCHLSVATWLCICWFSRSMRAHRSWAVEHSDCTHGVWVHVSMIRKTCVFKRNFKEAVKTLVLRLQEGAPLVGQGARWLHTLATSPPPGLDKLSLPLLQRSPERELGSV
jgi:hypothetical protein